MPALFGMYDFLSQNIINTQVVAAACIMIALSMVIIILVDQKRFIEAKVEGALIG